MKVSGEAVLSHPVDAVYDALNDPAVLVRTLPGCQRLEQTGPDTFKATLAAGVASIKGTFDGEVRLTDREAPSSFTMHASGAGAPGTVTTTARVSLAPTDTGGTLLTYDADATVGGVLGGVGQRMLTGVARKTAAEFFAAVDRDLSGVAVSAAPAAAAVAAEPAAPVAAEPAAPVARTWTRPAPVVDLAKQRMRDVLVGAAFGALVALLGVLLGAIVAGW